MLKFNRNQTPITAAVLLALCGLSACGSDDKETSTAAIAEGYQGTWQSFGSYLQDSGLRPLLQLVTTEVQKTAPDFLIEQTQAGMLSAYGMPYTSVTVSSSTVTFTPASGDPVSVRYTADGEVAMAEFASMETPPSWKVYKNANAPAGYKTLLLSPIENADQGLNLWEFRVGDDSAETLAQDLWHFPTLMSVLDPSVINEVGSNADEVQEFAEMLLREVNAPLEAAAGDWVSFDAYLDKPEMDAAYAAVADKVNELQTGANYTAAKAKAYMKKAYGTRGITAVSVTDNKISFTTSAGTQTVEYTLHGGIPMTEYYEAYGVVWDELQAKGSSAGDYQYLLSNEPEEASGGVKDWFFRFGDTGYTALANDGANLGWYANFVNKGVSAADFAQVFVDAPEEVAGMIIMFELSE